MYHIHDDLNYLSGDQIGALNHKYLNEYMYLSKDELIALYEELMGLAIKASENEEDYGEIDVFEDIADNHFIQLKETHLCKLKLYCLEEIFDRYHKGDENE